MICSEYAKKRLLLTATPFINNISDFIPLINLIYGQMVVGSSKEYDQGLVYESIKNELSSLFLKNTI